MGYKSIQSQINRAAKIKDAMTVLANAFGDEEFTRKQATAELAGSGVSFDAIVKTNGATKTREEHFTMTVPNIYRANDYWVYTSVTGTIEEFGAEHLAARMAHRYGGTYEKVPASPSRDIETARYYYTLTPAKLNVFNCDDIEREKAIAIAKLSGKVEELKAQIALLESL